jgi:hypothetical protein
LGDGRSLRLSGNARGRRSWATLLVSVVALLVTLPAGADVTIPPHSISINDVTMNEGNSGTTAFVFTVTLSNPPPPPGNFTIMVNYATANGTATAGTCAGGADYVGTSGQLTFNRNNLTRSISVSVCGDTVFETDEDFFVDLSNPTNEHDEVITKSRGIGTIRNDDAAPQRTTSTNVTCDPATVPVLGTTTCTATVTDTETGTSTPQGTVTFSLVTDDAETGAFTPTATCTLDPTATGDSNSCSVDYTPTTVGDGTHEIGASYTPTDGVHAASSDPTPFQLTVRTRTTSTEVSCTPSTIEAGGSTSCTATVTDTDDGTSTPQGTVSFSATGSGNSFVPASCILDLTATGDSNSCSVSYSSTEAATHTVTASYNGSLIHKESAGTTTVIVEPGPPFEVVVDPPTAVNDVDTEHCVTAKVTDRFGNPTPGITVVFTVQGSNTATGTRVTGSTGETPTFCYTGVLIGITDVITAFADFNPANGQQDAGEPFGTATKVWTIPVSTPLCEVTITQGGWIVASNGDRASFGGNAQVSNAGEPTGQEEYQDHGPAQPMNVKSTKILAVLCTDDLRQATIFGLATIDGSGEFAYRIDVQDLGEPGVGQDTYRIRIGIYDSGEPGTLEGGNVQIHKR